MALRGLTDIHREVDRIRDQITPAEGCRLWSKWSNQPDPPDLPEGGPAILFVWSASWPAQAYTEPPEDGVLEVPTTATDDQLETMQRVADDPPEAGVLRWPFLLPPPPRGEPVFATEADREAFRSAGLL
mgnify:FL=1